MDEKTHEGSKLLAKFIGGWVVEIYPDHVLFQFKKDECPDDRGVYHASDCMKYHEAWNWLMKVVKKLVDQYDPGLSEREDAWTYFDDLKHALFHAEVFDAFESVVNLVKYYK